MFSVKYELNVHVLYRCVLPGPNAGFKVLIKLVYLKGSDCLWAGRDQCSLATESPMSLFPHRVQTLAARHSPLASRCIQWRR